MIKLVAKNKYECSGCGACAEICPCEAISMDKDRYGVIYAVINPSKCIKCNKCQSVCPHIKCDILSEPVNAYAAITKCTDIMQSSSGGIFAALANHILNDGGNVYGAIYEREDNKLIVKHICTSNIDDISLMSGSKYVQSFMFNTYQSIYNDLKNNKKVLFCGTPCQCQAVKNYSVNNSKNLITIDIVCHGVPSSQMFSDFISGLEKKYKCQITSFNFRDKTNGWSGSCSIDYVKNGEIKKKYCYPSELSYYSMFENCSIMRPSCYKCKFAKELRVGDITIGDYWGIQNEQPELLAANGGPFDPQKGISLMIVNSLKGQKLIDDINVGLEKRLSTVKCLSKNNPQLSQPVLCNTDERNQYYDIYARFGYPKLEKMWRKKYKWHLILRYIINRCPPGVKKYIKCFAFK